MARSPTLTRSGAARPRGPLGALALAAAVSGCGGYGDLCETIMDCRGGNEADASACAIELDRLERRSELSGCDEEWGALVGCVEERGACDEGAFKAACDEQREPWEQCSELSLSL